MNSVFRSACFMILTCCTFFAACANRPPAAAIDEKIEAKKIIVAKVNNVGLTMDQLIAAMNSLPDLGGAQTETIEDRKLRVLNSIILLELAHQRASELGLNADDHQVQSELDIFKNNLGGEKEYAAYLSKQNLTEAEARANLERGLTINAIYTKEVVDRVAVPEEDLKREYESNKDKLIQPEKITAVEVYMLKDEGEASFVKAKELLSKIKTAPNQDPWKLVLDGSFMVKNTLVRKDRDKELYEAAKKLSPKGLSDVIRTATGPRILKLKEYSPEKQLTFEEAKPLILGKVQRPLLEKRTHEWEEELKKSGKIVLMDEFAKQPRKETP